MSLSYFVCCLLRFEQHVGLPYFVYCMLRFEQHVCEEYDVPVENGICDSVGMLHQKLRYGADV